MPFFVPPHLRPFVGPLALPLPLQKLNPSCCVYLHLLVPACLPFWVRLAVMSTADLATTLLPCLAVHVALLVQSHIPLVTLHPMLGQSELRKPSVYMGTGARWYSILWKAAVSSLMMFGPGGTMSWPSQRPSLQGAA